MGKWTPDDHGCIYDEAGCFARLTPNKAERLATRHNADIDALTAERDRLAAENAELRSDAIRDAGIECRLKAELAAANATLERLREAVPKVLPLHMSWRDSLDGARAILYPETLSIRDTAVAHGFDAMPADIAQRSVDGETNYVRLNPENDT